MPSWAKRLISKSAEMDSELFLCVFVTINMGLMLLDEFSSSAKQSEAILSAMISEKVCLT